MWEFPSNPTSGAQRIALYNSTGNLLFFDCIAQDSSHKGSREFTVEATIRCLLNLTGIVTCSARLFKKSTGEVQLDIRFSYLNSGVGAFSTHAIGSADDVIETISKETQFLDKDHKTDKGTFRIGDFEFNPESVEDTQHPLQPLSMMFRNGDGIGSISFHRNARATKFDPPAAVKDLVSASNTIAIVMDQPAFEKKESVAKGPIHRWRAVVGNLPEFNQKDFLSEWNTRVAEPFISTKDLSAGSLFSTIPRLTGPKVAPVWLLKIQDSRAVAAGTLGSSNFVFAPIGIALKPPDKIVLASGGVQPGIEYKSVQISFEFMRSHDDHSLTSTVNLLPGSDGLSSEWTASQSELIFRTASAVQEDSAPQRFRIGSLDFVSGNLKGLLSEGTFTADLEAISYSEKKNDSLFVGRQYSSKFLLNVAQVHPGAQDFVPEDLVVPENYDENEDCTISQAFVREFPLIIERTNETASAKATDKSTSQSPLQTNATNATPLTLDISEDTSPRKNRTIRVSLKTVNTADNRVAPNQPANDRSVVVLDRNPFLVAEVEFPSFTQQHPGSESAIVAQWNSTQGDGPSWMIQPASDQTVELIFPPQGIGETIAKEGSIQAQGVVDTRLAPPSHFSIYPSYFKQRYVEVPWNLRRILGYPGQRAPGVGIKQLQFELLYGLSCSTDYPYLRLAEIWSLFGQIPGRMRSVLAWSAGSKDETEKSLNYYKKYRRKWSELYNQYLNRLAIYEPWDSHQPGSLTLNEKIRCEIRETADLKRPVAGPACEIPPGHQDFQDTGILGGAVGGFESRNVYCALMRNPKSTGAQLVEPMFSAYGGYGTTTAEFDNGLTRISAHIIQGRIESYTVERFGRIAVFWNKAKHVIVYERTVAPSQQFPHTSLLGRAVVRKVREFVEILETTRNYPEKDTPPSVRGFVANCDFGKNAVIPVDGSWGNDVNTSGWKIPLWNPATQSIAETKDVYRKPTITLGSLCDENKKPIVLPQRLEEPEKLFFYTNTTVNADRDTDNWKPVAGIDYVDLASPTPAKALWKPDASADVFPPQAMPTGFSAFTYTVSATANGANVVADRTQQAISVVIDNVTMMRARPSEKTPDPAQEPHLTLDKTVQDTAADVISGVREIYQKTGDLGQIRKQLSDLAPNKRLSEAASNFTTAALKQAGLNYSPPEKFQQFICRFIGEQVKKGVDQFLADKVFQNKNFVDTIIDWQAQKIKLLDQVAEEIGNKPQSWTKASLTDVLTHEFSEFDQTLLWFPTNPEPIQKVADAVVAWSKVWDGIVSDYDTLRGTLIAQVKRLGTGLLNAEDLAKAQVLVGGFRQALNAYITNLNRIVAQAVPPWLPAVILPTSKGPRLLQNLLVPIDTLASRIDNAIRNVSQQANKSVQISQDQILSILNKLPQKTDLAVTIDLNTWQPVTKSFLTDWIDHTLRPVEDSILAKIPNTIDLAAIKALEADFVSNAKQKIGATAADVTNNWQAIGSKIATAAQSICGQLNLETDLFPDWTSNAPQEVDKCLELVNQTLQEGLSKANDWLQNLGSQTNNLQIPDFAIGLVRAFGNPPTVPGLNFGSDSVAYFFKHLNPDLDMSPVLAAVDSGLGKLKAFGLNLPCTGLSDQLIPDSLKNFDLSSIFRNFAGLNLSNMFSGLHLPDTANSGVHVKHGADPQSRRAWLEADIDVPIPNSTLFSFTPLQIDVISPKFKAHARFEVTPDGVTQRVASGTITADWVLRVGGSEIVTFTQTRLIFDEQGNVKFDIAAKNVQLAPVMSFLNSIVQSVPGTGSGFTIRFIPPAAAEARLDLALPPMNFGTVGIANLALAAGLRLDALDDFSISVEFSLGRRQAPFTLTIFILGGSGYIETSLTYSPLRKTLKCHVDIGIMASASLAIALGPIRGGVFVYFGLTAAFDSGGGPDQSLTLGVMLLIRGDVCLLGIVRVSLSLLLEAQYDGSTGVLRGHGHLEVSIKICWCFTLNVSADVSYEFKAGALSSSRSNSTEILVAANFDPGYSDELPLYTIPVDDPPPDLMPRCGSTDQAIYIEDFMNMLEF